jgi:hypothetical protein
MQADSPIDSRRKGCNGGGEILRYVRSMYTKHLTRQDALALFPGRSIDLSVISHAVRQGICNSEKYQVGFEMYPIQ